MQKSMTAGFPVHTSFVRMPARVMLACAVLCFATPALAEGAATEQAAPPVAVHELTGAPPVIDNPVAVAPGTATFQGLIPPAGSAVINPPHAADKSTAPAPAPTATVTYGAPKPDGEDTHPPLNLTADRAELVRLDTDAASVVVGNPENLNIQLENRKLLVLTPAKAGATYLSILDDSGHVIMQRHVIVSSPKNNYIRIRRSCNGSQANCQQTSVYYCPGMCHAVGGSTAMPSGTAAPASNGVAPAAGAPATTAANEQTGTTPATGTAPSATTTPAAAPTVSPAN